MDASRHDVPRPRRVAMRAALTLLALGLGCGPRDASKRTEKAAKTPEKPAPPAATPDATKPAPPLWSWVDSRAPLVMMWRPPHHNAQALADIFAFPAKAAQFYEQCQARVQDTERFLGRPLSSPELVAFTGGQHHGSIAVLRTSETDYSAIAAKINAPETRSMDAHEWRCAMLGAKHHQSLCLLDKPDIAWVPQRDPAGALDLLRMTRDLPPAPQQKALADAMKKTPRPIALLFSFAPSLHLELDEDPSSFQWTLFPFGQKDAKGRAGWTGLARMQHADPQGAIATLKSAQGLEDHPKAKTLRERAHLESPGPKLLEIHLEVHGDDPQAP